MHIWTNEYLQHIYSIHSFMINQLIGVYIYLPFRFCTNPSDNPSDANDALLNKSPGFRVMVVNFLCIDAAGLWALVLLDAGDWLLLAVVVDEDENGVDDELGNFDFPSARATDGLFIPFLLSCAVSVDCFTDCPTLAFSVAVVSTDTLLSSFSFFFFGPSSSECVERA